MTPTVELEWKFSPPDYFRDARTVTAQGCTITVANGKAQASVDAVVYASTPGLREDLHDALDSYFLGDHLFRKTTWYELSRPQETHIDRDGRRNFMITPQGAALALKGTLGISAQIHFTDKDGNIIDAQAQPDVESKAFAELAAAHASDTLFKAIRGHYESAQKEPQNFLWRLWDAREAMNPYFKRKQRARDVSSNDLKTLSRLCNELPLLESRHRATKVRELRNATPEEREAAFAAARNIIVTYLRHLG